MLKNNYCSLINYNCGGFMEAFRTEVARILSNCWQAFLNMPGKNKDLSNTPMGLMTREEAKKYLDYVYSQGIYPYVARDKDPRESISDQKVDAFDLDYFIENTAYLWDSGKKQIIATPY